jgi:hypothetical protein
MVMSERIQSKQKWAHKRIQRSENNQVFASFKGASAETDALSTHDRVNRAHCIGAHIHMDLQPWFIPPQMNAWIKVQVLLLN